MHTYSFYVRRQGVTFVIDMSTTSHTTNDIILIPFSLFLLVCRCGTKEKKLFFIARPNKQITLNIYLRVEVMLLNNHHHPSARNSEMTEFIYFVFLLVMIWIEYLQKWLLMLLIHKVEIRMNNIFQFSKYLYPQLFDKCTWCTFKKFSRCTEPQ